MQILSFDSSALTSSVALWRDDCIVAEISSTNELNHSVRLLPMIDQVFSFARTTLNETDAFAVSAGPGSFTGVRIGISTLKGLMFGTEKLCAPVSTLEALAFNECGADAVVCALMDARRGEFYNALFQTKGDGTMERLTPDRALGGDQIARELNFPGKNIIVCGDGARLFYQQHRSSIVNQNLYLSPPTRRVQRAASVACIGAKMLKAGLGVKADRLAPLYLRASGAERKREKSKETC